MADDPSPSPSPSPSPPAPAAITPLVLVRHGEAECNVAGRFGGPLGCTGLSDEGRRQVGLLRDRLRRTGELADANRLYASTLPRALETAEILAEALGLPIESDERVCELHPGEADNMTFEEYGGSPWFAEGSGRWREDPSLPAAPGGESWTGFQDRVEAALHDLASRHEGETIVVACHGGVVDTSMIRFLGMDATYVPQRFVTTNSSMTEWRRRQRRWRLVRYNDAAHLDLDDGEAARFGAAPSSAVDAANR
jgi:probable phosphoglycerate mutase